MKKEKKYLIPEMVIVEFPPEDVILTSDLDEYEDWEIQEQ